jgi:hypothetical protein
VHPKYSDRSVIVKVDRLSSVPVVGYASTLTAYYAYYQNWITHLSLGKDAPQSRRIQPAAADEVVEMPEVGGLHHHYEQRAA